MVMQKVRIAKNLLLVSGDILKTPMHTVVIPVSVDGAVKKGLSLSLQSKYYDVYEEYNRLCDKEDLIIGSPRIIKYSHSREFLMLPTREEWKRPSKIEYIKKGLGKVRRMIVEGSITSISFPAIGCGSGGLEWNDVLPVIYGYMVGLKCMVQVYRPI